MGTLLYITRREKTNHNGLNLVSGHNCVFRSSFLEMMATKQSHRKTGGRQYYHFVQSFMPGERLTPDEAHRIGLEFAAKRFPDFEIVVATHTDTGHLHNHFLVNSVSFQSGKKLHQDNDALQEHRMANDEICRSHGLHVLEMYSRKQKKKGIGLREYEAARRGVSWKFELIKAIEDALYYSPDREMFIRNMEYEGYEINWSDSRKCITYTCPNGMKCRDNKLHDETYLKENLEKLFEYRRVHGYEPQTPEPPEGWLAQAQSMDASLLSDAVSLGKNLEQVADAPPPAKAFTPADSKLKQRERIKKLAQGHQLQSEQEQEQEHTMTL